MTSDPSLHKSQHWVAESYLRQWRDPSTPQGAYIWISPKDRSSEPKKRSPKRTFVAADANTMIKQGQRNLLLEHVYGQFETKFGAIRTKIQNGSKPSHDDLEAVTTFVAAHLTRTPKFRAEWGFREVGDHAAQIAAISDPVLQAGVEQTISNIMINQHQLLSFFAFQRVLEIMSEMRMILLHTNDQPGFITSDSPCCVIGYPDTSASLFETLESKTGNLTMSLSPQVLVIFEHSDKPHEMIGLFPNQSIVNEANAMIWKGAVNEVVISRPVVKMEWFAPELSARLSRYSVQ